MNENNNGMLNILVGVGIGYLLFTAEGKRIANEYTEKCVNAVKCAMEKRKEDRSGQNDEGCCEDDH